MDRGQVLAAIQDTLAELLDQPDLQLAESNVATDFEDWDSLNHVRLMIELESTLGIRFETSEIRASDNVGQLIDLIQSKLST